MGGMRRCVLPSRIVSKNTSYNIMLSEVYMVSVNLEVNHKAFGRGIITSQNGKYITVRFDSTQKTFVYPDAFSSFLTLADGTVSEEIFADIEAAKREKQAIADKKNQENLLAMQKGIVIPGKEGAISEQDEEENRFKNQEPEEI